MKLRSALGAALAAVVACAAGAQTVDLQASADNTMYSESGDLSNGAGDYFFTAQTNASTPTFRRALIKFDIAGSIPAGSTINSVTLTMEMTRSKNGTDDTSLHLVLSDWGEGTSDASGEEGAGAPATDNDATWDYRFYDTSDPPNSPAWVTPGGDYFPTASATIPVASLGTYVWGSTSDMVDDVQSWLDNPAANYGWIVISTENAKRSAMRFNSRTHPTASTRPVLTVNYTAGGATGACCFADGSCNETDATSCANQGGTYQGDGTSCTPNPCPQPTGAACRPDGVCEDNVTEADAISNGWTYQGDGTTCAGGITCPLVLTPYIDPLTIPPIATPTSGSPGGVAEYDISMIQTTQQFHSQLPPTTIWTYSDGVAPDRTPGPTILAREDNAVTVNWINNLQDGGVNRTDHLFNVELCNHGAQDLPKTVTHLHGAHVPAASDGYPESTFLPGNQVQYVYPNHKQDATLLWYHDHALGITRLNVYAGMAAGYLVRDDEEDALGLPAGEYEVPLIIQDRTFNNDGSLYYPSLWQDHFFGDVFIVNGTVWPFEDVKQAKYRFRVLNGCNGRTLTLSFSNGMSFEMIGSEGGLLGSPVTLTELTLGPAERADLLVDFSALSPGTEVILQNSAAAPYPSGDPANDIPEVMKFVVTSQTGPTPATPDPLRTIEHLNPADAVQTRQFILRRNPDPGGCTEEQIWEINDLGWDDITEFPVLGTTEIWEFANDSGIMHPMHMHLVFFQVLDRQPVDIVGNVITPTGTPVAPPPEEAGWKDTVKVGPNEVVRVIVRFEDYSGLYAYHCHILEHEDNEMMRQFRAVCSWDITTQGAGSGDPDYGVPDGAITAADLNYFVNAYVAGDLAIADITTQGAGSGDPNYGVPDGQVTAADLQFYVNLWVQPCP